MRRSRLDVRFGRFLQIGQRWRRRADRAVGLVRQVHRADCLAELELDGRRVTVRFADLRRDFMWIEDPKQEEAA